MPNVERWEECDRCGERFVGEHAIRSHLRDYEMPSGEPDRICLTCLAKVEAEKECWMCDGQGELPDRTVGGESWGAAMATMDVPGGPCPECEGTGVLP